MTSRPDTANKFEQYVMDKLDALTDANDEGTKAIEVVRQECAEESKANAIEHKSILEKLATLRTAIVALAIIVASTIGAKVIWPGLF